MSSEGRTAKQPFLFTVPEAGSGTGVAGSDWSIPQRVTSLKQTGRISKFILRAPASSAITEVDAMVFAGNYGTGTDPGTVPDEDRVYDETAIPVVGNALTADLVRDVLGLGGGDYDTTPNVDDMYVSLKGTVGNEQGGVRVVLFAIDTAGDVS